MRSRLGILIVVGAVLLVPGVVGPSEFVRNEFPDQDIYHNVQIIYQSKEFQRNSVIILNLPGVDNEDARSDVRNVKMLLSVTQLEYCDVTCIFRIQDPKEVHRGVVVNFRTLGCKNLVVAPTAASKIRETYTYRNVVIQPVRP